MKTINKVILGFAIAGLITLIAGFALDGYNQTRSIFEKEGNYWGWRNYAATDITEEFSDIEDLEFDIDSTKVNVVNYNGSSIRVEARDVNKRIEILKRDRTLVINDNNDFWSFGFGFFNVHGEITVYIPEGTEFKHVELEIAAGSIDIDTLKATTLDTNVDAGKLLANEIVVQYGKFDADAGKIDINKLDGYDLEFDADAGNIAVTLVGKEEEYRYQADCDVGSLQIGSYKSHGIDSKDSGGSGSRRIQADCNAGKIRIEMEE